MTHENYMKFKFRCPYIKLYWNTAMITNFLLVQSHSASPKEFISSYLQKQLADPAL